MAREQHSVAVKECIYDWTAAYEQTWSHVRARIRLVPDSGITGQTMAALRSTWGQAIEATWSNRWALGRPPREAACPLTFEVLWVNQGEHHTVRVAAGPPTPGVGANVGRWFRTDGGMVAAHEFGHMLGRVDEYPATECPARSPVGTGTVMDNNSTNVPERMMIKLASAVASAIVPMP